MECVPSCWGEVGARRGVTLPGICVFRLASFEDKDGARHRSGLTKRVKTTTEVIAGAENSSKSRERKQKSTTRGLVSANIPSEIQFLGASGWFQRLWGIIGIASLGPQQGPELRHVSLAPTHSDPVWFQS